jgi:hypothetical protein
MRHIAFAAFPAVLVCVLTACTDRPSPVEAVGVGTPRAPAAAQGRPSEVTESFTITGFCEFDILYEAGGKQKGIELPGGRTITIFPGFSATLTNLDNGNQETLGITGAFHQSTLANGDVEVVFTGRNLLGDPDAGLVLAIGRFSIVFDAEGNLIQSLQGTGQLIDICELLA